MSNSLWPHESQHARPPCPSPTPRVYLNSCPSSRWYHPAISSSVVHFSSCLQSFPASGSFQMSQFFASGANLASYLMCDQEPALPLSGPVGFNSFKVLLPLCPGWARLQPGREMPGTQVYEAAGEILTTMCQRVGGFRVWNTLIRLLNHIS